MRHLHKFAVSQPRHEGYRRSMPIGPYECPGLSTGPTRYPRPAQVSPAANPSLEIRARKTPRQYLDPLSPIMVTTIVEFRSASLGGAAETTSRFNFPTDRCAAFRWAPDFPSQSTGLDCLRRHTHTTIDSNVCTFKKTHKRFLLFSHCRRILFAVTPTIERPHFSLPLSTRARFQHGATK